VGHGSAVALPVVLPMLYFRYHTMRYRFDAEGIRMCWGILFRHSTSSGLGLRCIAHAITRH